MNTNQEQDEQISKNAKNEVKSYENSIKSYNVLYNNCTDACQSVIETGTGINLPNDYSPRPNDYFKIIKEFSKNFSSTGEAVHDILSGYQSNKK